MSLCPRTLAIYRPGVPQPGLRCSYRYNGTVPNTGRLVCHTCGRECPRDERATREATGGRCNDLIVFNGGSVYLIRPVTEEGTAWLGQTAPDDAQWLGDSMAVEPRYVAGVVEAARNDGLEVA